MKSIPEGIVQSLVCARNILLVTHVSPDGDTLGASLAICEGLKQLGKHALVVCQDPVPELYAFLPGAQNVLSPAAVAQAGCTDFDTAMAVDVSDMGRMGDCAPLFERASVRLLIDHHATNQGFGDHNWIDPDTAATGMLAFDLLGELGIPVTPTMATHLYVALCTDTGNFQFSNTDRRAFLMAAELVRCGADVADITLKVYRTRSKESVLLLSRALSTLTFGAGGRVAWLRITRGDFEQTGATEAMTEGIVNYALEIQGVCFACLFSERAGVVKCSLRSKIGYDVSAIAASFGGGGHAQAAGATLSLPLPEAVARITRALGLAVGERKI